MICALLLASFAMAGDDAAVPGLIKYSGTIMDKPAGTVGVIFALYKDETGGAPLWQEVQNVSVDANGGYTVHLGARSAKGIPVEVFSSGEARWLGVQAEGQEERARVLLVSVPYAMKASDAETLGGLPASAYMRVNVISSQTVPTAASESNSPTANFSGANSTINPAITVTNATAGYMPVFTDSTGDLENSALFQVNAGTQASPVWNLGFGTNNPKFNLHFVSTTDPAAVTVDGYGAVGINFIGRRAEGTLANPTALLANDNIMAMQGRGYGATGFSNYSRAYMKFFAAEDWSDAAQGSYITLATTQKGTAPNGSATERMRIDDRGYVGIGTTTPTSPLTVAGPIQSTSGGLIFPDGTAQSTAASSITLSSPNGTISIAGSTSEPTVAVNSNLVQNRVTGGCAVGSAVASINADGTVMCNSVTTTGPSIPGPTVTDAKGNVL